MCNGLIFSDNYHINPCTSDPVIRITTNIFNHPLLNVDAASLVTTIGTVCCSALIQNPTSDSAYVCRLQAYALQTNNFLTAHFSDYTSHIADRCQLTYTGPVTAGQVLIDLNDHTMIFRDFTIPFSDSSIC